MLNVAKIEPPGGHIIWGPYLGVIYEAGDLAISINFFGEKKEYQRKNECTVDANLRDCC